MKRLHRSPIPKRWSDRLARVREAMRRAPWALPVFLLTVGMSVLFLRFLHQSPFFEMEELEIEGLARTDQRAIEKFLPRDEDPQVSLLQVQPRALEDALRTLPAVRNSRVERHWPSRLRIEVEEYHPVALVSGAGGVFHAAANGRVLDAATAAEWTAQSDPLLTGLDRGDLKPGMMLDAEKLYAMLATSLTLKAANPALYQRLSEIHWDGALGISLVFDTGLRALIGHRPIEDAGPVLERFLAEDRSRLDRAALVDLRLDSHLAWKPREQPKPPARPPKS